MRKKKRLWIVLGFKGELLRDTLSITAKEAKIRCINALWRDHPDYEHENVKWAQIQSWGWRCVRADLTYQAPR